MKYIIPTMVVLLLLSSSFVGVSYTIEKTTLSFDGDTLYVGGSGPNNYSSIQAAINDANPGDTVFVYDDSSPYYESIEIDKTINLIGENRDKTEIISGGDIITLSADFINISGFSILNFWGTSLYICSSYNSISYNNFSGFDYYEPRDHTGIEISNYNNYNLISNNNFCNLNVTSIDISPNCINTTIINNTFFDNQDDIIIRSFCHNTTIIGNKVLGNDGYSSIYIIESNNSIIKNNYVTPPDGWTGIRLYCSHNNIVDNNTIIGIKGSCGIHLWNSNHNNIYDNYMYNCGLIVINSFQNSVVNNTVNNKSLVYLEGYSDLIITNDSGQIVLVNCENITVQMQNLSCTSWGITLLETTNCSISDCIFSHIGRGISIDHSNNNIIMNNFFKNKSLISFDSSYNNTMKNNILQNNYVGILCYRSGYNTIINNKISNNIRGIYLDDGCTRNEIIFNAISNQKDYGIKITSDCYNNIIYHNEFLYNEYNAMDAGSNTWDDGYPSGGNFWDDYNGADNDGDGIGDTPYFIPGGNKDRFPLGNFRPDTPLINGTTNGKSGEVYNYSIVSTDPEGDDLYYLIDWGDGNVEEWIGPYNSSETIEVNHTWDEIGDYIIRVKAQDIYGGESDWGTLEVTMPYNYHSNWWFMRWLDRFPLIQWLLDIIR
ncbi:MAG: right-handed parallel beta-helix repeat-containing protein [Thermoplasmatales archaeon]|nr:MAG: right-handed parallel beta-helix repeat-containing protein [Thermoplasmatales archaeon]